MVDYDVNGLPLPDQNIIYAPQQASGGVENQVVDLGNQAFGTLSTNFSQLVSLAQQKAVYGIFFVLSVLAIKILLQSQFNITGALSWVLAIVASLLGFGFIVLATNWAVGT